MSGDQWSDADEARRASERDRQRLLESERAGMLRMLPEVISAVLFVATVVGIFVLRPTGEDRPDLTQIGINAQVYDATVQLVSIRPCSGTTEADGIPCQHVEVRLDEGPDRGEPYTFDMTLAETSPFFEEGDRIVMGYQPGAEERFRYSYLDRQRRPVLWAVAIVFGLVVVALGRLKGVAALFGLAATVFILLQFIVPSILDGRPPVPVAIVGAAAVSYVALYLSHGFSRMTTIALLGTLAALALTVLLSWTTMSFAAITGFASDESYIITLVGRFDVSGLILAGIVLGTIGAVDDVTITQASAVWELHTAAPRLGRLQLIQAGLRVGRDHVASMVNTLLLAYAGASMPLLIFFVLTDQSLGTVVNSEVVATEVLRTLVGSIGVVAAVPFTTWLAALSVGGGETR